jgi:3-dehydroquinate dehydratase-2
MKRVLVLHGPSLSHLGRREPGVYGTATLRELDDAIAAAARALGLDATCRQSNHEGALIDALLAASDEGFCAVVLNAGAYAHTSLAIADAVRAVAPLPVVEVHLSNTAAREPERQRSVVGAACRGRIEGFGAASYTLALHAVSTFVA